MILNSACLLNYEIIVPFLRPYIVFDASSIPDVRVLLAIFYSTFSGLGRPRTHAHALDGYEIFARIYKRPICLLRNESSLFLEGSRNSLVCC